MKFRKILSAVTALAMSASAVAGLAVTANADEETLAYCEDFSNVNSNWTTETGAWISSSSGNITVSVEIETLEDETENNYLKCFFGTGNGRGYYSILPDEFAVTTDKERVTFDFVFWTTGGDGANGYYLMDSEGNIILNLLMPWNSGDTSTCYPTVNGKNTFSYAKTNWNTSPMTWYTFDATLNFNTHQFSYKIYATADSTQTAVAESGDTDVDFISSSASDLSRIGYNYKGTTSSGIYYCLDNFTTYSVESTTTTNNVTIYYKDGDNEDVEGISQNPRTIEVEEGGSLNLANYYDATIYYDTSVYTYQGCYVDGELLSNTTLTDISADTDVTVLYEKGVRETWTPTIYAYAEGDSENPIGTYSDTLYVDEATSTTIYYPKYILDEDDKIYYETEANAASDDYASHTFFAVVNRFSFGATFRRPVMRLFYL